MHKNQVVAAGEVLGYRFGFLGKSVTYRFEGGEVVPVPQFGESKKWIGRYAYKDSFLYPPMVEFRDDEDQPVPNSSRPSHFFGVPTSHEICLDNDQPQGDRREHASLVIQLIAYLHGTWLQFEDWWFDARVGSSASGIGPPTSRRLFGGWFSRITGH